MTKTDDLISLMDKASAIAGSDYKLAQAIGVSRQTVSNWRHGHKPCPVEDQTLMAAIANLDPIAELARAIVRKHEGTAKGDMLMKALGKASLVTGAVLGSVGASAHQIFSTVQSVPSFATAAEWIVGIYTMCIM